MVLLSMIDAKTDEMQGCKFRVGTEGGSLGGLPCGTGAGRLAGSVRGNPARVALEAFAFHHDLYGLPDREYIKKKGHITNVEQLILKFFQLSFHCATIIMTDLGPAR
jgi:hypothetical protein